MSERSTYPTGRPGAASRGVPIIGPQLTQDPILFSQVVDQTLLLTVQPPCHGENEGLQREPIGMGDSDRRFDEARLVLGDPSTPKAADRYAPAHTEPGPMDDLDARLSRVREDFSNSGDADPQVGGNRIRRIAALVLSVVAALAMVAFCLHYF